MKWLSFFARKSDGRDRSEALTDRYKAVRKASLALNMALAKELPKAAVPECGKKLGLFKAGTLILNNDDEIAVLYDYCLHYYRRAGKNTIERHIEQAPPAPGSEEAALLRAMLESRYSLFRVEDLLPHRGVMLRDLLTGEAVELMDITLSETGAPGVVLAGRVWPLADFQMSSGTLIPVPEPVYEDKLKPVIQKFSRPGAPGSAAQEAAFVAQVIRVSLRESGEDNTFYTDTDH